MDNEDIIKKLHEIDEEEPEINDKRLLDKSDIDGLCEFCDANAKYACFNCEALMCYKHRRTFRIEIGYNPEEKSYIDKNKVNMCVRCFRKKMRWRIFLIGGVILFPLLLAFIAVWAMAPQFFIQSLFVMVPVLFIIIFCLFTSSR